jgi:hypothetical protein
MVRKARVTYGTGGGGVGLGASGAGDGALGGGGLSGGGGGGSGAMTGGGGLLAFNLRPCATGGAPESPFPYSARNSFTSSGDLSPSSKKSPWPITWPVKRSCTLQA